MQFVNLQTEERLKLIQIYALKKEESSSDGGLERKNGVKPRKGLDCMEKTEEKKQSEW